MASLEDLRALARTVHKNKIKNIHIIGQTTGDPTIFDRLYESLIREDFDDNKLMQYLYGQPENVQAYYKLKDRLAERLINTLFFIDTNASDKNSISAAYYNCYKNLCAIKILLGKEARKPAITLAKKTLKLSTEFTFTDITIEISKILRLHFGQHKGDLKKFEHYNKIIKSNLPIYQAELIAGEYYGHICSFYAKSNSLRREIIPIIEKYLDELVVLNKKYFSYQLYIRTKSLQIIYYEIDNNWGQILKTCQQITNYYSSHPQLASIALVSMTLLKKTQCLLFLRKFKEGEKVALEGLKSSPQGGRNWMFTLSVYYCLLLHSRQFQKARVAFETLTDYKDHAHLEMYKIHEAFIHYLIRIGKIKEAPEDKKLKPFRLGKFLNEVPVYSKDKRGSNITILILQILFLLEDKKYDIIIDRAESLQSYSRRYLKDDETYRSNCFIKMLLCLPAAGFEKDEVLKKARKYSDLLHAMPLEKAKQSPEVEVMPYEMLWEFVIDSLSRHQK